VVVPTCWLRKLPDDTWTTACKRTNFLQVMLSGTSRTSRTATHQPNTQRPPERLEPQLTNPTPNARSEKDVGAVRGTSCADVMNTSTCAWKHPREITTNTTLINYHRSLASVPNLHKFYCKMNDVHQSILYWCDGTTALNLLLASKCVYKNDSRKVFEQYGLLGCKRGRGMDGNGWRRSWRMRTGDACW